MAAPHPEISPDTEWRTDARVALRTGAELDVRWLGTVRYVEALGLQQELQARRLAGAGVDTVLLLEHPDVITLGRGTRADSLRAAESELAALGYDVHRVNRGGDVTYHGPGQLVGYPILDLRARGRADVHAYLRALENALIAALADFGIAGRAVPGRSGVWLDERRKIASIGVGLRRWCTLHGFALNVSCALARFAPIVPCGLADVEMVSMASLLGRDVAMADVRERVAMALVEELG
jgi:lipoyl(octanoyl) transferase